MNITWKITSLDRKTSDGYIQTAHWTCVGKDGEHVGSVYATCSFGEGTPSTPYENVTEAQVLEWIWNNGVDKEATEAAVAAQIAAAKTPVTASGLPW